MRVRAVDLAGRFHGKKQKDKVGKKLIAAPQNFSQELMATISLSQKVPRNKAA